MKALHARERDNVEDVLEDKLRIRQSNPLLKGLLLLSETFNVTDLAPAVLKRIEEVKKETGEEDIYSGKKDSRRNGEKTPTLHLEFPSGDIHEGWDPEGCGFITSKTARFCAAK